MPRTRLTLLTLLLTPSILLSSIDITTYLKKKLKQSPVGLLRYESPEALKQIIALPFDQIMLDHNAPIEGAKVIITYDKADNYDVASRNFTTLNQGVVNEIMDNEETRDKIDKKARKKRRVTRIALKEGQMIAGFNAGTKGIKIDTVIKEQFDDKLKELRDDEATRILERGRSETLRTLNESQADEIEEVKEQRREKKVKPPEVKKRIEAIRKKYRDKTKKAEEQVLSLTGAQKKELETTIAKPMEKLNGERQAFIDGYAAGTKAAAASEEEQNAKLATLRKAYQDKIEKIANENSVLKGKDRTPRDMPMSIELTGVLTLHKAELIPGEGEPANTKWEMPEFFAEGDGDETAEEEEAVEEVEAVKEVVVEDDSAPDKKDTDPVAAEEPPADADATLPSDSVVAAAA